VALIEGWAIPDDVEIGGKIENHLKLEHCQCVCLTMKLYLFQENTFKNTDLVILQFDFKPTDGQIRSFCLKNNVFLGVIEGFFFKRDPKKCP